MIFGTDTDNDQESILKRKCEVKQDKNKVLSGIYGSSITISLVAMMIVVLLEVFMLIYSMIDTALFGPYLWIYRLFYMALLTLAAAYIAVLMYVKGNVGQRYEILKIANPISGGFFYLWSLGIIWFDAAKSGTVDPVVFMTFSLVIPLSFYMPWNVYGLIILIADAIMFYITATVSGATGPLINLCVFFIFQIVLGISFLRLKKNLSERIVREQESAIRDALTGCYNRRAYEEDLKRISMGSDFIYVAIDINGLKGVNDNLGHEAGDRMILGAAQCIEECFGDNGKTYRLGGDEFSALIHADREALTRMLSRFEEAMASWSENDQIVLSASYGFASHADHPNEDVNALAKIADEQMYAAKEQYYIKTGKVRRT